MDGQHTVILHQQFTVFPGIEYIKEVFEDHQDGRQCAYILRIDRKADVRLDTVMKPDGCFALQEPTVSAKACRREGETLLGVINADFFNMTNGIPHGVVVMNGSILKEKMQEGTRFFGLYRDGTPVIGDETAFQKNKQKLKMAVGGRDMLVDGDLIPEPVIMPLPARHPRTAVGICENGDVLLAVLDGRNPGVSEGMHLQRFGLYLKSMGAKQALNLDGGGSTIMALRMPGQQEIETVNTPSDDFERVCANGIAVFARQTGDGVCGSAFVMPQQEYVAPGTRLKLSAFGLDNLLGPCALPGDVCFSVPNDSGCAVSADGDFLAAQTDCDVNVAVSSGERLLGTALLHVRTPDALHLPASCICTEGEAHELGVTATLKGRNVLVNSTSYHFKPLTDIGWFDDAGVFHARQEACEGDVLVCARNNGASITAHVRVGRLPQQVDIAPEAIETTGCTVCAERPLGYSPRFGQQVYLVESQQRECRLCFETAIPKRPRAVGMWVHALQGQMPDFTLTVPCGDEAWQSSSFEQRAPSDAVWTYMEAALPAEAKCAQTLRISISMTGASGAQLAIDSFRLVYDYVDDDAELLEIKQVSIHKYAQSDENERIRITAYMGCGDLRPYYVPVDYKRARILIDDTEYTGLPGHYGVNKGGGSVMLHNLAVSRGVHRLRVCAQAHNSQQTWADITFDTEQLEIIQ